MPAVELCPYCRNEVNTESGKYVVLSSVNRKKNPEVAHVECSQKSMIITVTTEEDD